MSLYYILYLNAGQSPSPPVFLNCYQSLIHDYQFSANLFERAFFHTRYSQSGVKITAPVAFPMDELDMGEYTQLEHNSAEKHGAGDFIYDLIACVCHEGSK